MILQEKDKLEILEERISNLVDLLNKSRSNDTIKFEYSYSYPAFDDERIIKSKDFKVYEIKKMELEELTKRLMLGEKLKIRNLSLEKRINLELQDEVVMN